MIERSEDILYVVMPAYNEEKNIEQTVVSWAKVLRNGSSESRIVVADSGSTDRTHEKLLRLKNRIKQLEILEDTDRFHGPKVVALYKYAINAGADYIFQTDSDGQTNPDEFEDFWNRRQEYEGIIGFRKKRGDGKARAFVEKVVCFLLRVFFKVKVPDANAPFRLMKTTLLKDYISDIPDDYALPNIILTAYFARFNRDILFREISFQSRMKGKNSINLKKIAMIGFRSLFSFFSFRKNMRRRGIDFSNGFSFMKRCMVIGLFGLVVSMLIIIAPSFPWNGGMEMTDSSVFLTIGRQMKEGVVPYVDTFDHKGPFLYLINFFGVLINETKGIFVFQFLALFFTLWFMFKIFRLKFQHVGLSAVIVLLLFTPFVNIYFTEGGNLTEQYAMPFIAFSLYAFLKFFLDGKISMKTIFGVGVGFACVLLMRINMVGMWAVFSIAVLIRMIYEKRYMELWHYLLWFVFGMMCVVIPIMAWLACSGALGAFWDSYVSFNLSYSGEKVQGVVATILYFLQDTIVILGLGLSMGLVFFRRNKKELYLMVSYLIMFAFCIIVACMSGRIYAHYGMVLVPLVIFPFAVFCSDLYGHKNDYAIIGLVVLFLVSLTFSTWLEVLKRDKSSFDKVVLNHETIGMVDEVCEVIERYTDVSDRITVYGNWNYVYLRCNRLPASKYSYQFPISEVKREIGVEYFEEIEVNKPKVFIVQPGYDDEKVSDFLKNHDYVEEKGGELGATVYILGEKR